MMVARYSGPLPPSDQRAILEWMCLYDGYPTTNDIIEAFPQLDPGETRRTIAHLSDLRIRRYSADRKGSVMWVVIE